ncbi:tumor necrosis factor receptor superfamily member 14-like [Macrosteles quadrilineatus]|uniref:tumor necrosis factor receptor superfamily member 14-like n=1 Tax=Macrosteles quadrilineatus TaxID=74068 RepID=UPI0023E15930|nr:tumor necrosis factor receptor superfamily member 14-like [Macrosteles quadrilineatus]
MRAVWMAVAFILQIILVQMGYSRLRHRGLMHCRRCGPGWGVVVHCSAEVDTKCAPCAPGSYSPHHSYHAVCWPCARCGPGLYQAHPCTPVSDTVCDSCERLRFINGSAHCPTDGTALTTRRRDHNIPV